MQQGQRLPNSRSQNEFFNPHREPVSGHLVFPQKPSEDYKATVDYFSGPLYQRPMHSGPLVPGNGWEMAGKEAGPQVSNKVNLPKLSGVAPKTSWSGDKKENPLSSRPREANQAQRCLESTNVGSDSRRRHDKKRHSQRIDHRQIENARVSTQTLIPVSFVLLFPSKMFITVLSELKYKPQIVIADLISRKLLSLNLPIILNET